MGGKIELDRQICRWHLTGELNVRVLSVRKDTSARDETRLTHTHTVARCFASFHFIP